jgi:hypothetical protein
VGVKKKGGENMKEFKNVIVGLMKDGDSVEGWLVDFTPTTGKSKSNIYTLAQPDGTEVGVWGSYQIDRMLLTGLRNIKPQFRFKWIRLSYAGVEDITQEGDKEARTMKKVKLEFDPENVWPEVKHADNTPF